jgi:hypothetical protein
MNNNNNSSNLQILCLKSLKRTNDLFLSNVNAPVPNDTDSHKSKIASKIYGSEYRHVKDLPPLVPQKQPQISTESKEETDTHPPSKKVKPNNPDDITGTRFVVYSFLIF